MPDHSLLQPWTGPFSGAPAFDKVAVGDFEPALDEGMAANLAEIEAIAQDPSPPSFDNTIVALERAGRPLGRAATLYWIWSSARSTPEFQALQTRMDPRLAAFGDRITQNEALFARIQAVYDAREAAGLTPEQQRLAWSYWNQFVRNGARLNASAKARVAEINQRLASLFASFGQNLQHDEAAYVTFLDEAGAEGLPDAMRAGAAAAAAERGRPGDYAILNTRSSVDPFLTSSRRRDRREQVWRTFYSRGDNGDAFDNKALITEILQLRAERATLLGFATHAHWRLADQMARTPDAAMELMLRVWPAATGRVRQEVAEMQAIADAEGADLIIAPWDYRFYAEKARKARFDLDLEEVKPYLQLEKLREAMFWCAGRLFGFAFVQVHDLPTYDPEMTVYEVRDRDGGHVGLWYFDPYAREGKNSGAWMAALRDQERMDATVPPIVTNTSNFVKAAPGQPVLISWDDARTMFHEFGHALHALCSNVTYARLSGTNVARDFVEFPSQLNENWLTTDEVMGRFLLHWRTGEALPATLRERIVRSQTFRQGFEVTEYLSAAILDMKYHLAGGEPIDPTAFERETLKALGMPDEVVMRHRSPQFAHVFSGDGYSAGYYSYLWAEVLDHDAFEAFEAEGGPFNPTTAERYRATIVSVGDTIDPAESFRRFRGRDPEPAAYLRAKGFADSIAAPG